MVIFLTKNNLGFIIPSAEKVIGGILLWQRRKLQKLL